MSQIIVKELLLELGGEAFTSEVKDLAKKRYPTATLHKYVDVRLKSMEKWGEVESELRENDRGISVRFWRIVSK